MAADQEGGNVQAAVVCIMSDKTAHGEYDRAARALHALSAMAMPTNGIAHGGEQLRSE